MKPVCTGFFTAIANKTRLSLIYALRDGPKSVGQLVAVTGLEQSLISHNLRVLRDCRVVEVEVKGKQRVYSLNRETIVPLFELVDKHIKSFCTAEACRRGVFHG